MLKRTLTGIVIFILTAGFISLRLVSPLFFDAFVLAIIYGSLCEFYAIYKKEEKRLFVVPLAVLPVGLWAIFRYSAMPFVYILGATVLILLYSAIAELVLNAKTRKVKPDGTIENEENKLFNITQTTMQVCIYPIITLSFLFGINYLGQTNGFVALILLFAVTMLTDVFAYVFGVWLGKNGKKLTPEISPKKSIIGTIFGLVGGIVGAGLCLLLLWHYNLVGEFNINTANAIILFSVAGVVGSICTQIGDLVASAFKRRAKMKDFGKIFPGHGGFTDRVDGLMITGVLIYALFIMLV